MPSLSAGPRSESEWRLAPTDGSSGAWSSAMVKLVLVGLGLGIVGAISLSGLLASQLFGVDPREPVIYLVVATALLAVGLMASFVPAWRGTLVDPAIAMRAE